MSTTNPTLDSTDVDSTRQGLDFPAATPDLVTWLEDQPRFYETTKTYTVRYGSYPNRTRFQREQTHQVYVRPDYDISTRASYQSQQDVADAWEEMQFPVHNLDAGDAHLYTRSSYTEGYEEIESGLSASRWEATDRRGRVEDGYRVVTDTTINYAAFQHPDGSGRIEHYDRLAAVRTRSGEVLCNSEDFAKGRALLTRPSGDTDSSWDRSTSYPTIPLTSLRQVLDGTARTLYDITTVTSHETQRSCYSSRTVYVVHFQQDDDGLLIGYDETAKSGYERTFATWLDADELAQLRAEDDPMDLLKPDIVAAYEQRGYDIMGSQSYGNPYKSRFEGESIVRQGEWFFVPMDEDFEPDAEITKHTSGGAIYESRIKDKEERIKQLPTECPECGGTSFEWIDDVTCTECDWSKDPERYEQVYVGSHGAFHYNTDQPMESHVPRDLAIEDDGSLYVRGTVRHADNDHHMVNFENWHLAVTHDRQGIVFNTKPPENPSGRSGGRSTGRRVRYD